MLLPLSALACASELPKHPTTALGPSACASTEASEKPGKASDTADDQADDPNVEWIAACAPGSPEAIQAQRELALLSHSIQTLAIGQDAKPASAQLTKLLEDACFALAVPTFTLNTFDSALSLKTFWDLGGEQWFSSQLEWGTTKDRALWLAPSARKTLTRESAPGHPLASLLCPGVDPAAPPPASGVKYCGQETLGWTIRAENAFHKDGQARRGERAIETQDGCARKAALAKPDRAFEKFQDCMVQTPVTEDALPLGNFQAPRSGWLVLRGRRGHHAWCDELRAYDLASGSAYIAKMCGGIFALSTTLPVVLEKGIVPLDALREAAWAIYFARTVDHDVLRYGEGYSIPDALLVRVPKDHGISFGLSGMGGSSGRSTLTYQWVQNGKSTANGTVDWPDASYAADEHATQLLKIAEAGFVPGCAPKPLPTIPWAMRLDKSKRVDPEAYFPDYAEPEFALLETELDKLGAQKPCK